MPVALTAMLCLIRSQASGETFKEWSFESPKGDWVRWMKDDHFSLELTKDSGTGMLSFFEAVPLDSSGSEEKIKALLSVEIPHFEELTEDERRLIETVQPNGDKSYSLNIKTGANYPFYLSARAEGRVIENRLFLLTLYATAPELEQSPVYSGRFLYAVKIGKQKLLQEEMDGVAAKAKAVSATPLTEAELKLRAVSGTVTYREITSEKLLVTEGVPIEYNRGRVRHQGKRGTVIIDDPERKEMIIIDTHSNTYRKLVGEDVRRSNSQVFQGTFKATGRREVICGIESQEYECVRPVEAGRYAGRSTVWLGKVPSSIPRNAFLPNPGGSDDLSNYPPDRLIVATGLVPVRFPGRFELISWVPKDNEALFDLKGYRQQQ